MKLENKYVYKEEEVDLSVDIKKAIKTSEDNYQKLRNIMTKCLEKDRYLGNYFRLRVADGYAYYQVVEYNKTKDRYLCVRCEGICLDEWADSYIGNASWVDSDYVKHHIDSRMALESIFSKK